MSSATAGGESRREEARSAAAPKFRNNPGSASFLADRQINDGFLALIRRVEAYRGRKAGDLVGWFTMDMGLVSAENDLEDTIFVICWLMIRCFVIYAQIADLGSVTAGIYLRIGMISPSISSVWRRDAVTRANDEKRQGAKRV